MQTAEAFEKEKLEVDILLASGIFSRAPNLAHLLKYVCDKYFDGAAEEIKEYNIAVEALGRRPEFDQKRDSIVRVEAHRLRKRLREYYESEGALHELHIEIPSGQYTPKFVLVNHEGRGLAPGTVMAPVMGMISAEQPEALVSAEKAPVVAMSRVPFGFIWKWVVLPVLALCAATGGVVLLSKTRTEHPVSPREVAPVAGPGDEIRILCGVESGSYTDAFERTWQSDRYFTGGGPDQVARGQIVLGTRDQQIYRNRREGTFRYDIPLKPGAYELRLYFAETMFGDNNPAGGGETTRLFEIRLNGKTLASYFDVIADAGASTADIKIFKDVSPAADGLIHLEFLPNTNVPFLNAIEILPGIPGKMRAYRIAARDHGLTDSEGKTWDPDHYGRGGQIIVRPNSNVQNADPELFRSERFGNLTYSLPVAQNGKYTVNLYFAENWFGPGNPGGSGVDSRTFDILVNGVMLRKNFDILKEAGGTNKAVVVSEHGVEANHQGKIVISLAPNHNYACINGLEVIDESR